MSSSMLGLQGCNALVTGAGQGGGRGIALQLARAGVHVAVVDLDTQRAATVADEVRELGVRAAALHADVRDPDAVRGMVDDAREQLGPLHVGVNNVGNFGANRPTPALELDWDFWQSAIDLNLRATFQCAQAFARAMLDDGVAGAIVNVASLSGVRASPNLAPYGAAKAGVIHLTQTLALEWAPHGIRVNCVAPTAVDGPSLASGLRPRMREAMRASIPLGELCSPEALGDCVLMLASRLARFVTGETVMCDGGSHVTTRRASISAGRAG